MRQFHRPGSPGDGQLGTDGGETVRAKAETCKTVYGGCVPRLLRGYATSTQGVCHAKLRVSAEYGYVRCDKGMCTAKSRVSAIMMCICAVQMGDVLCRRAVCLRLPT